MEISVTKQRGGKFSLASPTYRARGFLTGRELKEAAKGFGVDVNWLAGQLHKAGKLEDGDSCTIETPNPTADQPTVVHVRGLVQHAEGSKNYEGPNAIIDAIKDTSLTVAEPLIYWSGLTKICAVDADFHSLPYDQRPTRNLLSFSPSPTCCWVTHGRGLRLIYVATETHDADEIAAIAAVRISQLEPLATVELKSSTRHPGYPNSEGRTCSAVEWREQRMDVGPVLGWLQGHAEADQEQIDEWLRERGYKLGSRYTHDRCPVNPGEPGSSTPVVCYANGIFCFKCQALGVRRGTRAPGWFPYSVFIGEPKDSIISTCVSSLVHWEHARFLLASVTGLPDQILRGAYGALLKHDHPDDPRIPKVFTAGTNIVRLSGRWATLAAEPYRLVKGGRDPVLSTLPSCLLDDGKTVNEERVARFSQTWSLHDYGYPHLQLVFGMPIYGHHMVARYPYNLVLHKSLGEAPKYIRREQRMREDAAWYVLEKAFPGLNRNAIKLLIAAKGCAEADGTMPPFVFITGPTSSAKSTSVVVAAAIAGDTVRDVPAISDDSRIRAAIMEAKENCTYVTFNEAVKDSQRAYDSKTRSMEFALSLTPDSLSHKLYLGPVAMGTLPVLVWTDVYIPQEIKQHAQLARRFVYVHLDSQVDWSKSMKDTGMMKAENLRANQKEYIEAADAILSCVIDECFSTPNTFIDIARSLGFATMAESDDATYLRRDLRAFFDEVQSRATDNDGWVGFDLHTSDTLATMWNDLSDPDRRSSQRCSEVDWRKLVSASEPIQFCVRARGHRVKVKFTGVKRETITPASVPIPEGF